VVLRSAVAAACQDVVAEHHDEMESFVDDDIGYLAWLAAHPDGFVMNADRETTPTYLVLLGAGASWWPLARSTPTAHRRSNR
jgi:hypothetical protein